MIDIKIVIVHKLYNLNLNLNLNLVFKKIKNNDFLFNYT